MYTPLFSALKKNAKKQNIPFHMPGHKGGKALPKGVANNLMEMDTTELPHTDNLQNPTGCIQKAEEAAAACWGATHSFYMTGGATCGIHAMLLYAVGKGGSVLMDRNCHISAQRGMQLLDITPQYLAPTFLSKWGIPGPMEAAGVQAALAMHPSVSAVYITSPNYYGICSDIAAISAVTKKYGKLLIVDEAHGAHFPFSPLLPTGSMRQGANICVQSVHKTMPAPTGAALLHCDSTVDPTALKDCINLFHTTSPSYLTMGCMDAARGMLLEKGQNLYSKLYNELQDFEHHLKDTPYQVLSLPNKDFSRLVIHTAASGLSGFEVSKRLCKVHHIAVEMADLCNIVCITGPGNSRRDFLRLSSALKGMKGKKVHVALPKSIPTPCKSISPSIAAASPTEMVSFAKAKGRIAAGNVFCYPPGAPVIAIGDVITNEQIGYIEALLSCGGSVLPGDSRLLCMREMEEDR